MNELKKLHTAGFIHREIHHSNILFYERDFNLYFIFAEFNYLHYTGGLNKKKQVPFNEFSAPEINTPRESFQSDIFSLGCLFKSVLSFFPDTQFDLNPLLIKFLDKMTLLDVDLRPSLEDCILFVLTLPINKEDPLYQGDIFNAFSEKISFQQPNLQNFEDLKKIFNEKVDLSLVETRRRSNRNDIRINSK